MFTKEGRMSAGNNGEGNELRNAVTVWAIACAEQGENSAPVSSASRTAAT